MYQIDKIKGIFISPDTNTTKSIFHKTEGFLLPNLSRYSFDGSFLSEAPQKDYDRCFAAHLDSETNLKKHNIKAFLDFHFISTPNKKFFIEHLEYYIIPDFMFEKDPVRLKIIAEWIGENKIIKTQQAETEQDTPTFTNNFDNIKPTEIYNHFKAGLVEKGYLTEQELNEYLKAAFELKTKPETLFKLKHTPTKQKIYTVFYVYYKDISQKKHEKQKEYAALLGDFFEGYKTKIIQTNWARDYKAKR